MKKLIVLAGLIGSGKSKVADELVEQLDAVVLKTDYVFHTTQSKDYEKSKTEYITDREIADVKDKTYQELMRTARDKLSTQNVILDATFSLKKWREWAKELARETGASYHLVEVSCDDMDALKERLDERSERDKNAAPYEVRVGQEQHYEEIASEEKHYTINNNPGRDLDQQVRGLLNSIETQNEDRTSR